MLYFWLNSSETSGILKLLSPIHGSGYTPSFTSAFRTVVGTIAGYHASGLKLTLEIISPPSFTLTEDLMDQSPESISFAGKLVSLTEQENNPIANNKSIKNLIE